MGVRNIPRRWGRTSLIVVGLMLGTAIITAALSTGDTMSYSVRSLVVGAFGHIDEMISVEGASAGDDFFDETTTSLTYFDQSAFDQIRGAIDKSLPVDGIAPVIIEDVAVQDRVLRSARPALRAKHDGLPTVTES